MRRSYRALHSLILWLGVTVFGILMLNILISIAARYLGLRITNIDWVEETSRFLFIWLSFLGAALAVERMVHIRIDFFAQLLPARPRLLLEILVYTAMVVFAAVVTYALALRLFGVAAGVREMLGYLPVIFFGAAMPGPMHSVAIVLWVVLFPERPGEMTAFGFIQQ